MLRPTAVTQGASASHSLCNLQSRSLQHASRDRSAIHRSTPDLGSEHPSPVCAVCWATGAESQVLCFMLETEGHTQLLLWPERLGVESAVPMRSFSSKAEASGAGGPQPPHQLRSALKMFCEPSSSVSVSQGADCYSEHPGDNWLTGDMNGPGLSWTGSQGSSYVEHWSVIDSCVDQAPRAWWRRPRITSCSMKCSEWEQGCPLLLSLSLFSHALVST